jgi:hypothetical protein
MIRELENVAIAARKFVDTVHSLSLAGQEETELLKELTMALDTLAEMVPSDEIVDESGPSSGLTQQEAEQVYRDGFAAAVEAILAIVESVQNDEIGDGVAINRIKRIATKALADTQFTRADGGSDGK